MRNRSFINRLSWLAVVSCAGALGCGGSGTVSLQLTDAPPDLATMKEAVVTIGAVGVHLAGAKDEHQLDGGSSDMDRDEDGDEDGDGGWRLLDRPAQAFDLLRLRNDVVASLGELELPPGKITQ